MIHRLPRHDHMRPTQQLSIAEVARAKHADNVSCWNRAEMELSVSVMKHLVELLMSWLERRDSHSFEPEKECTVDSAERLLRKSAERLLAGRFRIGYSEHQIPAI